MLDQKFRATHSSTGVGGKEGDPLAVIKLVPQEISEEMFSHDAVAVMYSQGRKGISGKLERDGMKAKVTFGAFVGKATKQKTVSEMTVEKIAITCSKDSDKPMKSSIVLSAPWDKDGVGEFIKEHHKREFNVEVTVTQLSLPGTE